MNSLSLAVVVLAAAPSPQFNWSVISPSGAARLTQRALPDEACELECIVGGKPSWTLQRCMGRTTDFNFVSDDCATALTLFEYPLKQATAATTPVAVAITGGTTSRTFFFGQLGAPSRGEGKRLRWLGGVVGEPGVKPHVNEAETGIEFMTVEGQLRTVRFSSLDDFLLRRAAPAATGVQATGGMYQFTAADGSTQFVMGLDQVPRKFRKSARRVESEIGVVQGAPRNPAAPTEFPSRVTQPPLTWPVPTRTEQPAPAASNSNCHIVGLNVPEADCMALMGRRPDLPNSSQPRAEPPKPPPSPFR